MRKHFARLSATTGAALLLTAAAPAALAAAPPGPYLGVGAGLYTLDVEEADFEFDDEAGMFRAFGGFRVNPYWAVEVDYQRLAETKDEVLGADVELEVDAWTLSVRPILPIGEVIDLYGRAGWTWYEGEATASSALFDASLDESGNEFTWGAGVDFHLGDMLTLRGDFSRIEFQDTDLDIISASIMLRF